MRSLRNYAAFSRVLRRGGLYPKRPTARGLRAYSDEQLLALRSRYENLRKGAQEPPEATFGFQEDDSFSLGPLNVLPGTFEMQALRVEWEAGLILRSGERQPEIGWWTESRHGLLPRARRDAQLVYALRYTEDSVRALKRRYGYRADRWHTTVPEGKLWDAVRDYEDARRIQAALSANPGEEVPTPPSFSLPRPHILWYGYTARGKATTAGRSGMSETQGRGVPTKPSTSSGRGSPQRKSASSGFDRP